MHTPRYIESKSIYEEREKTAGVWLTARGRLYGDKETGEPHERDKAVYHGGANYFVFHV